MAGGDGESEVGRARFRDEDALTTYLRARCGEVIRGEFTLRERAEPGTVHDTRVALRRLRSLLRTCAPLLTLDDAARREADEDLRWLAGLLADIRDADVLEHRITEQAEALPPSLVLGSALPDAVEALHAVRCRTVQQWRDQRTTDRFRSVMRTVARWYDRPPVAGAPSAKRLRRDGTARLEKAERAARRRLKAVDGDEALHRARRSLKRLRYTAEAFDGVVPGAERIAKRARRLQRALGEHQDLLVEIAFLRHLSDQVGAREGHNAFTYGVLLTRAEQRAAELRSRRWRW